MAEESPNPNAPFHPIIYVRGFAMTRGEIDETAADPFCGFNLGSTVMRASADKEAQPRKFVFESPVVRLASEFNYVDVYEDGYDIMDGAWDIDVYGKPTGNVLTSRSVIVYRYYDPASRLLGKPETPSITEFAKGLSQLIARVRELLCKNPKARVTPDSFRCYLVAHSMGGLVCRAFLQNAACDTEKMAGSVDKFFTYATPHNGIEFAGFNVPRFLTAADVDNFNRSNMREYLDLRKHYKGDDRVDLIPESQFPSRKVFCMVGTNRMDYEVAAGLSRTFVGHGSDGLVKIENATLCGLNPDGTIGAPCAKAFAFRSHSGFFGIVNSEEAYQNLTRFLFGDVRVDIWLDIEELRLPEEVQKFVDAGKAVDALYKVELTGAPKGKLWQLTRRKAEEDSVACITQQQWDVHRKSHPGAPLENYLSTVFLSNSARVNSRSPYLTYILSLSVFVPDFEVERRLMLDRHFEGERLFTRQLILSMDPPTPGQANWQVKYMWGDSAAPTPVKDISPDDLVKNAIKVLVPINSVVVDSRGNVHDKIPGIKGTLRFVVQAWNADSA